MSLAVAGLGDACLSGVSVTEVIPSPDIGQLRVVLDAPRDADVGAIERALDACKKTQRWEVAAAIHRKRVPLLSFAVVKIGTDEE